MWNAFGSGPGSHGGGGCVAKAPGWEFVPCSRLGREGGRAKSRSPLRTLSPPASFCEQQGARQELQAQHARLKKKLDELKRRHGQDKEEWMREKEVLLRQVADIQGGENRRILLDLKSVLDDVQLEVKREEAKRGELQLQYVQDRCSWELERAELKCRVAQLEARDHSPCVEVVRGAEPRDSLRREQAEQKRLLADTHTAAMDLRCRLEHSERGWMREKSELLERFDLERKEWESQLRDMQRKIEELYSEVKAHREVGDAGPNPEMRSPIRLSLHSASSGSTALTDPSDAPSNSSSSYSTSLVQHSHRTGDLPGRHSNSSREVTDPHGDVQSVAPGLCDLAQSQDVDVQAAELEDILQGCLGQRLDCPPSLTGQDSLLNPFGSLQSLEFNCGTEKKKNITALNAALREIARVSEELCSYQDEIRMKSGVKRSQTESLFFPEEFESVENVKNKLEMEDAVLSLNRWCRDLQELSECSWDRTGSKDPMRTESECSSPLRKTEAPPIPPRSTSWYLNSTSAPEPEISIPEPPIDRKCQSPCVHLSRKCNSPSVVRKFEAMLQENEGKILTDSGIVPCTVPADSKCNVSCCHNRWSCDASRFGSSKSSTYVPVQKSLSEVNILTMGTDCSQGLKAPGTQKGPGGHPKPMDIHVDLSMPSLDILPPCSGTKAPCRNEMLEQKTAKFNRTLFQAEMGRGFEEDDSSISKIDSTPQEPKINTSEMNVVDQHYLEVRSTEQPNQCLEEKHPMSHYAVVELEEATVELLGPYGESKLKGLAYELPQQYPVVRVRDQIPTSSRHPPEVKARKGASSQSPEPHSESVLKATAPQESAASLTRFAQTASASSMQVKYKMDSSNTATGGLGGHTNETKFRQTENVRQDVSKTRSRILNENPWKPTTLAAYPRPVDSRSNYGAVERILKSFESSDQAQQLPPSPGKEDDLIELLDMLDMEHLSRSGQRLSHTSHRQATGHKEIHVTLQQSKESSVNLKKSFSRPACPANRRLPSRWASRSPSSSSTSSSTSSSPVTQATLSTKKQTFSYSAFHTETVII